MYIHFDYRHLFCFDLPRSGTEVSTTRSRTESFNTNIPPRPRAATADTVHYRNTVGGRTSNNQLTESWTRRGGESGMSATGRDALLRNSSDSSVGTADSILRRSVQIITRPPTQQQPFTGTHDCVVLFVADLSPSPLCFCEYRQYYFMCISPIKYLCGLCVLCICPVIYLCGLCL